MTNESWIAGRAMPERLQDVADILDQQAQANTAVGGYLREAARAIHTLSGRVHGLETTRDSYEQFFRQGEKAAESGLPAHCPHNPTSTAEMWWVRGFDCGQYRKGPVA